MPVVIPKNLPAVNILEKQNIFIMDESRALHQDIRPLRFAILNLMPKKIETETNLLLLLSNSPIQIEITLLHPKSHKSKNTSENHLLAFYKTFDEIKGEKYDGFIITGAPVEQLDFENVNYWQELTEIMDYIKTNVTSSLFICWGAQAGLYHYFGVEKYPLKEKMFGVFHHKVLDPKHPLFRGFDDDFFVPHSRHTEVKRSDIEGKPLNILAESKDAGIHMVSSKDNRLVFVTGHAEYDPLELHNEYVRDVNKNLPINIPRNYYEDDDPAKDPVVRWRAHGNLWFQNWINFVYQETPFDINDIK